MKFLIVTLCIGLFLAMGIASCSINSNVEVQSGQEADDGDKPGQPQQSSSSSAQNDSTPSQETENSDDPMYTMKGFKEGTLGSELEGFAKIKVIHQDWSNGPENKTVTTGEITDYKEMREIFRLVNPKQTPTGAAPTCLFSHMVDFVNNDGGIVGRVGLCESPEFRRQHPGALVTFTARGKQVKGRSGLKITSAPALAKAVEKYATD